MAGLPRNIFESFEPVQLGDWGCKISTYSDQIMVFMWHRFSLDTYCEFFQSEREAVMWMEYMGAKYV